MAQRVANIMKPFATGLVVGKFAPLHCGHEKLINTALAQCEELFIISYSVPEMPDCEPEKRLTWLQVRFPQATFFGTDARACCAL
ncbi:Nicotinamide-nucleotide adenylyltransferase, NadR family / Ribosylnicotinamide kinase [Escherichia coli ISC41]|nr:Nicotinamide-nucleotide adenylyltransferase, NadR family / Ribosylnicotinamide kinase [Escherichia coli ISC41]